MNKLIRTLVVPAMAMTIALPAMARPGADNIYDRIHRQEARIERGIDRGDLTRRESRTLRHELGETRELARSFRHRGLSPHEFRILDRRLDRSDRLIRRLTSNRDVSYRSHDSHRRYDRYR